MTRRKIIGGVLLVEAVLLGILLMVDWVGWHPDWTQAELLRHRWGWFVLIFGSGVGGLWMIESTRD